LQVLTFALIPLRFLFPHGGVLGDVARALRGGRARATAHARMAALAPHSIRYGKEVGAVLLVYVVCLAYAAVSPTVREKRERGEGRQPQRARLDPFLPPPDLGRRLSLFCPVLPVVALLDPVRVGAGVRKRRAGV
jgi:hypothetical protein